LKKKIEVEIDYSKYVMGAIFGARGKPLFKPLFHEEILNYPTYDKEL
jgi:hypothetical protein